jgi:hypothetical protein
VWRPAAELAGCSSGSWPNGVALEEMLDKTFTSDEVAVALEESARRTVNRAAIGFDDWKQAAW